MGLLYSSVGVGSLLAVLAGAGLARGTRLGHVVVLAVLVWGGAIALAGLTSHLWLALVLLAVAGAADSISGICRSTMMQTATPDHLRGRVASVFSMVVAGGPYLGDLEGGAVGALFTPAISVVSGGVLCVAGVAVVTAAFPELWRDQQPAALEAPQPGLGQRTAEGPG